MFIFANRFRTAVNGKVFLVLFGAVREGVFGVGHCAICNQKAADFRPKALARLLVYVPGVITFVAKKRRRK